MVFDFQGVIHRVLVTVETNSTPPIVPHHTPDFYRTARRKALGPNRSPPQWSRQRLKTPHFTTFFFTRVTRDHVSIFQWENSPPRKNKKRDLVKSISEAEICFALRPSEGWRQNRLKSWGYQQRAGSVPNRRVLVGTGRGSPKHLREAGWKRVLPISNFRGRKRQLQERVHVALAANSCGNDASFKHIIIFKRRAEICS